MKKLFEGRKRQLGYLAACFIGAVVFFVLYGITPLDVTNDKWIYNGYCEPDLIQHYAGWVNYRNSNWNLPIGKIDGVGHYSNYLPFTDCIPLFAILFKVISSCLPETFQYFGLFVFCCFLLQGLFSYKIFDIFVENNMIKILGTGLLCFSPIFIERAFRHSALASHWIILAAIYIFFSDLKRDKLSLKYIILIVLSVSIHAYFVPMVIGIMLADTIAYFLCLKRSVKSTLACVMVWACGFISMGLVGWIIGLFSVHSLRINNLGGYGYFTSDLNSIINPISQGYLGGVIPEWSRVFKVHGYAVNTYVDGFFYFGLGCFVIVSFTIIFGLFFPHYIKKKMHEKITLLQFAPYIFILVCFCIYGYSNKIWFNGKVIFEYPVPRILYPIMCTFKSSGRYLWPVFYSLIIFSIIIFYKSVNALCKCDNKLIIFLMCVIGLQVFDLSKVIKCKYDYFKTETIDYFYKNYDLYDSFARILRGKEKVVICDPVKDPIYMYKLSLLCGKNNLQNNINIMNRGTIDILENESKAIMKKASDAGFIDEKTVYVFMNYDRAMEFVSKFKKYDIKEIEEKNGGRVWYLGLCHFFLVMS